MAYTGAYPDIYPWIASRLKEAASSGALADPGDCDSDGDPTWVSLDAEIASVIRALVDQYPCVISYASLTGDDESAFSEAAGLMVASRLLNAVTTGGQEGTITSEKYDTVERTFAQPGAGLSERDRWEAQAYRAMVRIPCIGAIYGQFGVSGVTLSTRSRTGARCGEFGTPDRRSFREW